MSETANKLVRLEPVNLRSIWNNEGLDFTPWLSKAPNLSQLGEALGLELELDTREQTVGRFSADLLCKDVGDDRWVVIENQIEPTDHKHLGQLLTYAAGLEALSIVWVAAKFADEHRAAIDWLNEVTVESVRFFGVEVQVWKIGDSAPAVKFDVVSKPNAWSRHVRAETGSKPTQLRTLQQEYWQGLNLVLDQKKGVVRGNKKSQPRAWMNFSIGRSDFRLVAAMVRDRDVIRVEIYIRGADAKGFYRMLERDKSSIESELGSTLRWEELPERQDSRVSLERAGVQAEDRSQWPDQHDWLATNLNTMHRVFASRIRELDVDEV